jgi:glycerol kinase
MSALLLGIDEGTTAVKAALYDLDLRPVAETRRAVPTQHPGPGLIEQDPELILEAVIDAVGEALARADGSEVLACGLAHQGESVLAWDAESGRALTPVIVWQDKRQQAMLAGIDPAVIERSGLPLDPYFSAGKLRWLLEHDDGVRRAAEGGVLRLGTVDSFLTSRLGGRFATDLSTASRTQLLALGGRDWDEQLLRAFSIGRELLPALGPTFGSFGDLRAEAWPSAVPLAAQLVDQQAALAGSGAIEPGELKATYGTGVFVLARTDGSRSPEGLLPTVAWATPDPAGGIGEISYALEGGVFAAGSLLEWLSADLGLAADVPALAAAAASVPDSEGVIVLPAIAGLGAPWWQPSARGIIAGLHPASGPAHIARAALEAIAWRVADIVEAIAAAGPVESVRVDGGLTNSQTLLQIQADALGLPLHVGRADTTALGAAMLAGVGAGAFASVEEAARLLPAGRVVEPRSTSQERSDRRARWKAFVEAGAQL